MAPECASLRAGCSASHRLGLFPGTFLHDLSGTVFFCGHAMAAPTRVLCPDHPRYRFLLGLHPGRDHPHARRVQKYLPVPVLTAACQYLSSHDYYGKQVRK